MEKKQEHSWDRTVAPEDIDPEGWHRYDCGGCGATVVARASKVEETLAAVAKVCGAK